jgi:hypothetical protein
MPLSINPEQTLVFRPGKVEGLIIAKGVTKVAIFLLVYMTG